MERELMISGIGGQGVQLCAQVIARAATAEGRQVLLFGLYGGQMRGGNTESTVIVADRTVSSPPIVSHTWSAIVMHHQYWENLRAKLKPAAAVVVNSSLFEGGIDRSSWRVFDIDASKIAGELGNPLAASMVMAGAYAGVTELVGLESLVAAMRDSLPPYRKQHAELNENALRAGYGAVVVGVAPAWAAPANI
jgi:Pyruvate/2-oxoacid:ferredoxin oxidoreductase gamma subunit